MLYDSAVSPATLNMWTGVSFSVTPSNPEIKNCGAILPSPQVSEACAYLPEHKDRFSLPCGPKRRKHIYSSVNTVGRRYGEVRKIRSESKREPQDIVGRAICDGLQTSFD
jgi:hypothetical protein